VHNVSKKITQLVKDYCNANTIGRKDQLLLNKINAIKAFYVYSLDLPLLAFKETPQAVETRKGIAAIAVRSTCMIELSAVL
jgi:hypothetical protein